MAIKISIVTVVRNNEQYIEDCIKSVLSQDYPHIEYIVIDGASTDGTLDVVKRYSSHIQKIVSEKDLGIYDAMNKGIQLATGDIVGILNSDDLFESNYVISSVAKSFIESRCDCLYGDLLYVDRINPKRVLRKWYSGKFSLGKFKWGWMPPHPTFYVRKEIFQKYGLYRLELKIAADYELMLRYLEKEKLSPYYLNKVLVRMRWGGTSNKNIKNIFQNYSENKKAWALNNLNPYFCTLFLKRIKKVFQFF